MTQPSVTTCYRHPDRETGLSCTECGRPICTACSIDADVGQRCPECVARQGRQTTVNVRSAMPTRRTPVTMSILAVTVALYALRLLAPEVDERLFERLAMWNAGVAIGEWWRTITVVLLHASTMHILFNMWALYNLGPQIERELGGLRLVAMYVASAATGSAFAYFLGGVGDVGVGASGAIFGLFGVWLASALRRRNTRYGRYLLNQLGVILLINAALPFIYPRISWQAHLGGLLAGFAIGYLWGAVRGPSAKTIHLASAAAMAVIAVLSTQLFVPFG